MPTDTDPPDAPSPWLARLVLERELLDTGRAASTGVHLTLWGPAVSGLSADQVGALWGLTEPELADIRASGDALLLVLQTPGSRWGEATAPVLARLLLTLRPEQCALSVDDIIRACAMTPGEAETQGLREAQRALTRVFGLRDPVFGSGRISVDAPAMGPFFLDTQAPPEVTNPLLPDTASYVTDYAETPAIVRLAWASG